MSDRHHQNNFNCQQAFFSAEWNKAFLSQDLKISISLLFTIYFFVVWSKEFGEILKQFIP